MKTVVNATLCTLLLSLASFNIPIDNQVLPLFPALDGKSLTKQNIQLPDQVKGKWCVLVIAFSESGAKEKALSWVEPITEKYMGNPKFEIYEILMFPRNYKIVRSIISKEIREGAPKSFHGNIMIHFGALKAYQKALDMPDRDSAYIFVLNPAGEIVYRHQGKAAAKDLTRVEELLEKGI